MSQLQRQFQDNSSSTWFRWLRPASLFSKNEKCVDFEVNYGGDSETPLKPQASHPQLVFVQKNHSQFNKISVTKGNVNHNNRSRMVTVSGSRFLQKLGNFYSEITTEPILFLYMLSTFSQYASFQDLVYSRACLQSYASSTCDNLHEPEFLEQAESVQATASHLILLSTTALVLPSIFIAVYLGSWGDRFGRKKVVMFPPLGGVLSMLVYICLAFQPHLPIQWIFLASFLSGLFGGFVSCIMSCMSYVSAVSSEENRTVRISRLEAMIFLGGTVGPFLSGSLLQYIGHGFSFVFMMGCYLLAFLYALFCVKEVGGDNHGGLGKGDDDTIPHQRPQSSASSTSVVSSSLKSTTLESRHAELDLESAEHLLAEKNQSMDLQIALADANLSKSLTEAVFVETAHPEFQEAYHHPSPYQPLSCSSGCSGHSHFEDASSTAASEDEQRNILRRSRNSQVPKTSCCSTYFGSEHFFGALKTVIKKREGGRRLYLILILVTGFISMMITAGELDVAYLFAKGEPLKWNHKTFSYYFGVKYGLGTLVLLVGMPLFQHFKINDPTICVIGLFSRMAGLVLYALSPDTTVAFLVPIVAIFSFFSIPAQRSLLSKLVLPDEQGKVFAFVAILEDVCTLTASLVFNSLYPITRPIMKGFIFLLAAALLIVPVLIMWFVGRRLTRLERLERRKGSQNSQEGSEHGNHL